MGWGETPNVYTLTKHRPFVCLIVWNVYSPLYLYFKYLVHHPDHLKLPWCLCGCLHDTKAEREREREREIEREREYLPLKCNLHWFNTSHNYFSHPIERFVLSSTTPRIKILAFPAIEYAFNCVLLQCWIPSKIFFAILKFFLLITYLP